MRKLTLYFQILLALVLQFLYHGCTLGPVSGGTSTSENGRVAGRVMDGDGSPASQAMVTLLSASYNPVSDTGTLLSDTTDASGSYHFSKVKPGAYTVQSRDISRGTRALAKDVVIDSEKDSAIVDDCTLRKPGSIRIAVPGGAAGRSGYAYIPGTTNSVTLQKGSSSSHIVLDSVPVGRVDNIVFAVSDSVSSSVLDYTVSVEVREEDTATVLTTGWRYQRELRLNTTSPGADIEGTLHDFPVLIRLNEDNFDFSQAHSDGEDLLFTKEDGTGLPHEIERWDPVTEVAEVWVKVDTLPGNAVTVITMHWGNLAISGSSDGRAVFDTAAGFLAVWHMGEAGDSIDDASANNLNGVRYGMLRRTESMIGYGQKFDSAEAYCDMGNVLDPGNGDLTVSAWLKRSGSGLETVIAKSEGGEPSDEYGWNIIFGESDEFHAYIASAGTTWSDSGAFDMMSDMDEPAITDTAGWHYIAAVFDRDDNGRCRLYIDGMDVTDSSGGDIAATDHLRNDVALRIGAEADGEFQWTGSIDECVVAGRVRSGEWIRLCYINQGPEDRLVEFEP